MSIGCPPEDAKSIAVLCRLASSKLGSPLEEEAGGSAFVLQNFQWRLGVAAASSECDQVGASFLQLRLEASGSQPPLLLEMTLPQFYQLLSSLQQAARGLSS